MTLAELRDRLIADGLAEVRSVYEEGDLRRLGAIEGFELCRSLETREAFERVLMARRAREARRVREMPDDLDEYWRHRFATLQVEWVLNCLIVAWWARPGDMVSARAAMKVAEILGVEGHV